MFKFRWNSQWVLLLSLLDILVIVGLMPAKSWANSSESAVSTINNVASTPTSKQLVGLVPQDSSGNSDSSEITPVSQLLSPVVERSPNPAPNTISPDPTLNDNQGTEDDPSISQVNSVSQLSDIKPTDWAFQALQSLVERYGVIAGYTDGTFKGNRALTRYEFAAGLNAALDRLNDLIGSSTQELVRKQDLETLKKLQEEFSVELTALRQRVDQLDARTATLQQQQFSPIIKLAGRVEIVAGSLLAGNNVVTKQPAPRNVTFQDYLALRLSGSFNGKDAIGLTLGGGNIESLGQGGLAIKQGPGQLVNGNGASLLGTYDGRTADNASITFDRNSFLLTGVRYKFLAAPDTQVNIYALSDGSNELGFSVPINPYFEATFASGANGISRFSRRALVYNYGDSGAGIAVLQRLNQQFQLGLAYSTPNGNNPTPNNGFFSGRYLALAQLLYTSPSKNFRAALAYVNTYSPAGTAGLSGTNFGPADGTNLINSTVAGAGTIANLYGIQAFYQINPKFAINGWASYAAHRYIGYGDGKGIDWAVGLAFLDSFRKGSTLGLFVGQAPTLISLSKNVNLGAGYGVADKNFSLHIEAFYQYKLSDNIDITPGLIWVTAPNADDSNPASLYAWVRTLFRF